jgi:hypothetical protein
MQVFKKPKFLQEFRELLWVFLLVGLSPGLEEGLCGTQKE